MGLSGAPLQKEGPESGAVGAKGLQAPGGTSRTHPRSQAEAAEQVFGQGDLLVLRDTGGVGTDRVVPSAWAHRLHLSVRSPMTLIKVLKCCKMGLLIPSELVLKLNMIVFLFRPMTLAEWASVAVFILPGISVATDKPRSGMVSSKRKPIWISPEGQPFWRCFSCQENCAQKSRG